MPALVILVTMGTDRLGEFAPTTNNAFRRQTMDIIRKRFITVLLSGLLILGAAACSSDSDSEDPVENEVQQETDENLDTDATEL